MSASPLRSVATADVSAPAAIGRLAAAIVGLAVLAGILARGAEAAGVSLALVLVGGVGLIAILLLAVARYDAAVAVGFLLMGIVRFEPAPPDAVFAIVMAVAAVTGRFHLDRVPRIAVALVASLILVNVVSLVDAVNLSAGVRFLFITSYLGVFALWLTGYVRSPRETRIVVVTWLAIAAASAVVSIAMLKLPLPGRTFVLGTVDGGERVSGFFKDPNVFGPFLVPIALILLDQRISQRERPLLRLRGTTALTLFLVLVLGIVFSFSRAAWGNFALSVAVLLVVSAMRRHGARRAIRLALVMAAMGGAAGAVLVATGSTGFLQQRAHLQAYDTQRFGAQQVGYELGWTHPVGVGPGQFTFHWPVATHSTFVRVFAEQGLPGLLTWVGIVIATLVLALRSVALGRDTYGIGSSALLAAWCGLVFNSFFVDTLHWRHLWVVAALIWASAAREDFARRA